MRSFSYFFFFCFIGRNKTLLGRLFSVGTALKNVERKRKKKDFLDIFFLNFIFGRSAAVNSVTFRPKCLRPWVVSFFFSFFFLGSLSFSFFLPCTKRKGKRKRKKNHKDSVELERNLLMHKNPTRQTGEINKKKKRN